MDVYIKSILEGTGGDMSNSWSWKEGEEEVMVGVVEPGGQQEWGNSEQCETLESVVAAAGVSKNCPKGGVEAQTIAARVRRRNISDKMKELESLIPSGGGTKRRVETVKMLEEAIRYVTYLKAQLEVLESPCHSAALEVPFTPKDRERRLALLLMSPAIQRNLYKQQCCLCIANYAP